MSMGGCQGPSPLIIIYPSAGLVSGEGVADRGAPVLDEDFFGIYLLV